MKIKYNEAYLKPLMENLAGFNCYSTAKEGDYFDVTRANKAIQFIEGYCRHTKGPLAGKLIKLEQWQHGFIAAIFGWMNELGFRRFREVLLFLPRKNGKSILVAAIGLYMLFSDGEQGAEIYAAAGEREQASLVWGMAEQMILKEPVLAKRCRIYKASKSIQLKDGSIFKPISADAGTKHGFNASCVLMDELHAQKKPDLVEVLETSMGSRAQPLFISLTTSDFQRENSICNDKHAYASDVRDEKFEDSGFLPVIFEASINDDWKKEETWEKANPNYGVSINKDFLSRECKKAIASSAYQNTFKRLYLNIRTETETKFIMNDDYDACIDPNFDESQLIGAKCYAGLDLASTTDLCSFSMFFPEFNYAKTINWLPQMTADKALEKGKKHYTVWGREGWLRLTPGNVADYDMIRQDILVLNEKYNIAEIAIDRWNSTQLQTQLAGDGIEIVPFGQGFGSMSAPTKELERVILSQIIIFESNPLLKWCTLNVTVEHDAASNIKPSKDKRPEKIDATVALIMAIGRSLVSPESCGESVYEERGILFL